MIIHRPDLEIKMTGEEKYPVETTDLVPRKAIDQITKQFKGLPRYAGCVEKNGIAQKMIGGIQVLGTIHILSARNFGCFWMEYHPPLEFHSWLMLGKKIIIDFALPGIIERASKIVDSQGPIVEGRRPFILIGEHPPWMKYAPKQTIEEVRYEESVNKG